MLKKIFIPSALALFLFISLIGYAFAIEFSADSIYKSEGKTMKSKIFMKEDRYRTESPGYGGMGIIITRLDKKVVWMLQPEGKMYMEMPFKTNPQDYKGKEIPGEVKRELIGTEMIDGRQTKKYKVTYKSGKGVESIYQWIADDINFPVKTAAIDGKWSQEFKNIKVGNVSNLLFEIPAGYKKVNMPMMPKMGK